MPSRDEVRKVAPALERYTHDHLLGDVWKRPGLAPRDRSVVTIAALIARNQTTELPYYVNLALDHGVKPREISEIITHLAFYSGCGNAMSAVAVAKDVFAQRQIGTDQLSQASPPLLPLDQPAEAERAARVSQQFGAVAPGIVQYTTDALFRDLWLRPDLAPRDRSLVTVSALIASGHVGQIQYHLNRAMTRVSRRLRPLRSSRTWPSTPAGPTRSRRCRSQRRSSRNVRNQGNRSMRLVVASGRHVPFEPGARTAWAHPSSRANAHPDGGLGLGSAMGSPTQEIRDGDVVWIPAGQKHWHGATATTGMTHIAIQEFLDGKNVDWMKKVSDEQYGR